MRIAHDKVDNRNEDQQRAVRNSRRSQRVHTVRVRNPRVVPDTPRSSRQWLL